MSQENLISKAVELAGGPSAVAAACGLGSYQAVCKWMKNGHLPRTEWTGETSYAPVIESLIDAKRQDDPDIEPCSVAQLLSVRPAPKGRRAA